jgi:N-acetylneuraminic acid mutarotase
MLTKSLSRNLDKNPFIAKTAQYDRDIMSKSILPLLIFVFLTASFVIVAKPALSSADVIENSWERKYPMQQARSGFRAAVVNGKIYAIGGSTLAGSYPYTGGAVGTNEEYDSATNRWTYKTPMPTPRAEFGIAVYQNKIYCIGDNVNEVYDPLTDAWENRTSMPTPRHRLDANVVDGKIYLIGGYDSSLPYGGDATDINEVYDPETDTWNTKAPMPVKKCDYTSAVVGDKIHIIGGGSFVWNREWNLHQIYDTKTDSWSYGAPFPSTMLYYAGAGVTSGVDAPVLIYVFGEMRITVGEIEHSVRVYDPESDSWTDGADIPTDRGGFGVAVLDDMLYVIGGETSVTASGIPFSGDPPIITLYATNERYTPFGYGTIPPRVGLVSPGNRMYNVTSVSLDFTVNKAVSWMGYCLDRQENMTITGNATLAELSNGLHNVRVYVNDTLGNTGASDTIIFSIAGPEPFPTAPVAAASVASVALAAVGVLVYFRKRKRRAITTSTSNP